MLHWLAVLERVSYTPGVGTDQECVGVLAGHRQPGACKGMWWWWWWQVVCDGGGRRAAGGEQRAAAAEMAAEAAGARVGPTNSSTLVLRRTRFEVAIFLGLRTEYIGPVATSAVLRHMFSKIPLIQNGPGSNRSIREHPKHAKDSCSLLCAC